MALLGYALLVVGFLIAALGSVFEGTVGVNWTLLLGGLAPALLGVVIARTAARKASSSVARVEADLGTLQTSLDRIVSRLGDLNAGRAKLDVYDLPERIDQLFLEDLDAFAEARESLAQRFGLQAYADLMSHFAAGERSLNRVWCCSVDGYVDEAHAYLDRAAEHFADVRAGLRSLAS